MRPSFGLTALGLIAASASLLLTAATTVHAETSEAMLQQQPGVILREMIYEKAPFPECHASTIVETPRGLVASWFGGTRESHPDVGIWVSRQVDGQWTTPVEVANGVQSPEKRYPCWNPVLFQAPDGPLMLFYKVGPTPSTWWGMLITSNDGGKTWSTPTRLPDDIPGPIKNKPILLADGRLLSGSSTEDHGWRVHFEITTDLGRTWQRIGPINDGKKFGAIQPTLLTYGDKRIDALSRTRQGVISRTTSTDGGKTWSEMEATSLPNPNSGIDAVALADGRKLLVYNHLKRGRGFLNVAVRGKDTPWQAALVLEDQRGEFSYPAVIQTADGLVHTTYTWKRKKVRHVVIDPSKLQLRDFVDGQWPR